MANLSAYKVDLNTPRPNPNNPLEVRKGDAPKTAFEKFNNVVDLLGSVIDGSTVINDTAPAPTVAYMSWIDTSANPALLKRRNAANKTWVTIGPALQAFGKDIDGMPLLRRDMKNLVAPEPANRITTLGRLSAEPRFISTIDLTGLSTNRYYPVWWQHNSSKQGRQKITIARVNNDDANLDPFGTGSTTAALLLEIEQTNHIFTTATSIYTRITNLSQLTRKTVRQIRYQMRCSSVQPEDGQLTDNFFTQNAINPYRSGLYLRGGLTYRVLSNFHQALEYSRTDTEVVCSASATFTTRGAFMVKSYDINDPFLGPEYDNFTTPYNEFPYPL